MISPFHVGPTPLEDVNHNLSDHRLLPFFKGLKVWRVGYFSTRHLRMSMFKPIFWDTNALPRTNSSPQKNWPYPKRKRSSSNPYFSGVNSLVLGRQSSKLESRWRVGWVVYNHPIGRFFTPTCHQTGRIHWLWKAISRVGVRGYVLTNKKIANPTFSEIWELGNLTIFETAVFWGRGSLVTLRLVLLPHYHPCMIYFPYICLTFMDFV